MTKFAKKTSIAAAVAFTATFGVVLPAAATPYSDHARVERHHAMIRNHAYHVGYNRGFRDGHYAAATGRVPGDVVTGRSAYVEPGVAPAAFQPGVFGNGGVLGLGILGGNGLLGTGVLDGQGALGVGVLGF